MKAPGLSRINRGFGSLGGRSAPRRGVSLLHISALFVLLIQIAGCVTDYSGGTQMSSDPDAALDKRVALTRQYVGVGDWENAKRNLELAQEVDPNNAEVFEAFALVYQSTGEFEMAEDQFRAALKAEPTLSRARNNYAAFLYSQGRYIEAEREFYRVTEDTLYSGRPMAFVNLGLCKL
jgi:type IV pilus assembly protein PilF